MNACLAETLRALRDRRGSGRERGTRLRTRALRGIRGALAVTNYDAIVVGAGHNGLTNAAYPRALRAQGAGARAQPVDRRCSGQPRDPGRVDLLELLIRLQLARGRKSSAICNWRATDCRSCPMAAG